MRVLVTGATGFLGSAAVPALRRRSQDVVAVGPEDHDLLADDPASLVGAVRPTHRVHPAWHPAQSWREDDEWQERWCAASAKLLRAFARAGGVRALVPGSGAEYCAAGGAGLREDAPPAPDTAYGRAKVELHRAARGIAEAAGVSLVWPRVFHAYGPREPEARLVPTVAGAVRRGARARLTDGAAVRDPLYVEDVAEALAAVLLAPVVGTGLRSQRAVPSSVTGNWVGNQCMCSSRQRASSAIARSSSSCSAQTGSGDRRRPAGGSRGDRVLEGVGGLQPRELAQDSAALRRVRATARRPRSDGGHGARIVATAPASIRAKAPLALAP